MQKVLKKYGIVLLFYITVVGGVFLLNSRLRYLNNQNTNLEVSVACK